MTIPTQAQIEAADKAYDEAYEKYKGERGRTHGLALIAALTAAEAGKQKDSDLNDVLMGFTNYVMNERVRSYNEGMDATIERCAQAANRVDTFRKDAAILKREIVAAIRAMKE